MICESTASSLMQCKEEKPRNKTARTLWSPGKRQPPGREAAGAAPAAVAVGRFPLSTRHTARPASVAPHRLPRDPQSSSLRLRRTGAGRAERAGCPALPTPGPAPGRKVFTTGRQRCSSDLQGKDSAEERHQAGGQELRTSPGAALPGLHPQVQRRCWGKRHHALARWCIVVSPSPRGPPPWTSQQFGWHRAGGPCEQTSQAPWKIPRADSTQLSTTPDPEAARQVRNQGETALATEVPASSPRVAEVPPATSLPLWRLRLT